MAHDEGLSIEETNKLRLSLGLKPLNMSSPSAPKAPSAVEDAHSTEQQDSVAVANYNSQQEADRKEAESRATADRIRKVRNRAERDRKLVGVTLGDDDDEENTLTWIKRTKAPKPRAPLQQSTVARPKLGYSSENLEGLRVRHDLNDFEGGDEVVLTLEDNGLLDEEAGDELINVSIKEKDALQQKLETKKRKSVYAAYEDDEVDARTGEWRILGKYDGDADSGTRKQEGFAIRSTALLTSESSSMNAVKHLAVSLDAGPVINTASDYNEPVKIKKPKKQKAARRQKLDTGAEDPTPGDLPKIDDTDFVDDDELQVSLARQRRIIAQKRAAALPKLTAMVPDDRQPDQNLRGTAGLVLDETTEFTRGLQDIKLPEVRSSQVERTAPPIRSGLGPDIVVTEMTNHSASDVVKTEISTTGIEDEATFDQGLGPALAMLRQKGHLKEDQREAELKHKKETWLARKRRNDLEIERERRRVREELKSSQKFRNMSVREREAYAASENKRLDALQAKADQENYKDYRPDVDIKYYDDFGRTMTSKEAFKHMSHQFHGKGSGSGKTAKKLARVEKEKADEQKSLF